MGQADVIIVGGGTMGLAIALELHQQGTSVTVLSKDFAEAAGHAAAGMLAPSAEKLTAGPMAELCLRSLHLYPTWASKLEEITGKDTGYWPCGILLPRLTQPETAHSISASATNASAISASAIHTYQAGLSPNVTGGTFYPEDAQVDNRALLQALRLAVQNAGIEVQTGIRVEGFVQKAGRIISLRTTAGDKQAERYVLATGAWSGELLPIPVSPRKGQMFSVRVTAQNGQVQPLRRVLYGEQVYIVPRKDGRIVVGATAEDVGFAPGNTAKGLAQLFEAAIALYPAIAHYPIEETWWGFRPATPDELPILGPGPCENLTLATGHYRNGILLTPITANLIARHLRGDTDPLLQHFSYKRFTSSATHLNPPTPRPPPPAPPVRRARRAPPPAPTGEGGGGGTGGGGGGGG
ncbi:MAG: glycine oxidase ThiO, partial [Cyanobacteria bacterium J06631_9]